MSSFEDEAQKRDLAVWESINTPKTGPVKYQPGEAGYGPEFCSNAVCGKEMPAQRRAWGYKVCVSCQELREKRQPR